VYGKGGAETGKTLEEKHGGRRKTGMKGMGRGNPWPQLIAVFELDPPMRGLPELFG